MKALVKEGRSVALIDVPPPELRRPDDVIVDVICAGICRTDLHVATGAIASADPITLGHELCGRVIACGPAARVAIGDLVSADPRIDGGFLGVTHHGAFAERVLLPGANVWKVPDVDPRAGAYLEPIASALAVACDWSKRGPSWPDFEPRDRRAERWLLAGNDRFSRLIRAVLRADPAPRVESLSDQVAADTFDVAIETSGSEHEIARLVDALRPGGALILKSRQLQPISIPIGRIVAKQLVIVGAHYGEFQAAVDFLADGFDAGELIGDSYALADFEQAFAAATASEARKVFLTCAA